LVSERANVLKIDNLSISYGPIKAVTNVSLEVNEGEFVALIGANGAGKSTLLQAVLGINPPRSGRIVFMGNDITLWPTEKIVASGIVLVPEGKGILSSMTVLENLQLGGFHLKGDISEHLRRVFERFPRLAERNDQVAGTLSGGERQMLSIARGMMSSPKLIMLDEPSLGLSPIMVESVFNIMAELNEEGYSILLSEQNAQKSLEYADHAYLLETGNLVISGSSQELASDERVRKAYLGG